MLVRRKMPRRLRFACSTGQMDILLCVLPSAEYDGSGVVRLPSLVVKHSTKKK